MAEEQKKVILSGIQPSGGLHIGNLIGAISNWVNFQYEYRCYYTIVDLHAITVRQKPADLRKNTLDLTALLLACGVDPAVSTLFIQSHVREHAELSWVLNTFTQMGELSRMTQFKDKSRKYAENINVGLFTYPVLQAADILLYQADLVPVGEDQKQHLELTRDIAVRFNNTYSPTFMVPDYFIPKVGARIMSLTEPAKKMSKSDENDKSAIYITDGEKEIINKVKRSVTDSGTEIKFTEEKPGIRNLISLYNVATGKGIEEIEKEFEGKGYGDFKAAVGEAVAEYIRPIREKYEQFRDDKNYLQGVLTKGAEDASRTANKTLRKVYKKVGFVQL